MLVIQLDTDRLRKESLAISDLSLSSELISPNARVERINSTTLSHLHFELAKLAKETFDVVIIVGHSNRNGICLGANEPLMKWAGFAQYLKPFEPRRLALIACEAGRSESMKVLFNKLPKLRRIYACPVTMNKSVGKVVMILAPLLLTNKAPTKHDVQSLQTAVGFLTGGQIIEWRRGDKDDPNGILRDLASEIVAPFVRRLPELFD